MTLVESYNYTIMATSLTFLGALVLFVVIHTATNLYNQFFDNEEK